VPRASTRSTLVGSQKVAAEQLGITATALRQWMREPGFPDSSAGFDLVAIRAWVQAKNRKGSSLDDKLTEIKVAREMQRLRLDKARADKAERHDKVDLGELLPRRKWELFAATLLTHLGDAADQLPDLLAAICCPDCAAKVRPRLADELDAWRNDTADELRRGGPQEQTV
jgi:hypothetical protein